MFIAVSKKDASICFSSLSREELSKRIRAHGGYNDFSIYRLDGTVVDHASGYLAPRLHFYPTEEVVKVFPSFPVLSEEEKPGRTKLINEERLTNKEDEHKNEPWDKLLPPELRYWRGIFTSAIIPRDSMNSSIIETPYHLHLIPNQLDRFKDTSHVGNHFIMEFYPNQTYTVKREDLFYVDGTIGKHLLAIDDYRILNIQRRAIGGKVVYGYTYLTSLWNVGTYEQKKAKATKMFSQFPAPVVWFENTGMSELISKVNPCA